MTPNQIVDQRPLIIQRIEEQEAIILEQETITLETDKKAVNRE